MKTMLILGLAFLAFSCQKQNAVIQSQENKPLYATQFTGGQNISPSQGDTVYMEGGSNKTIFDTVPNNVKVYMTVARCSDTCVFNNVNRTISFLGLTNGANLTATYMADSIYVFTRGSAKPGQPPPACTWSKVTK